MTAISSTSGIAPTPPGRLGVPVQAGEAFGYLEAMQQWLTHRKGDLDTLDTAALAAADPASFTSDLVVSMALWKAIADRLELLVITFDSGRVGPEQAERLATLIWGRLDVNPGGASTSGSGASSASGSLAVSLPEACRLSDAMTSSLRGRLGLEATAAEAGARIKGAREGVERLRDQIGLLPAGPDRDAARERLTRLDQRLIALVDKAKRGADVGGTLGPLELDVTGWERDLIIASGRRLQQERDRSEAVRRRDELAARGDAIRELETQCVRLITPAPRLAVPDVRALGEVPTAPDAVDAYLRRLATVGLALDRAHAAYSGALAERDEVTGLAGALLAQVTAMVPAEVGSADLDALTGLLADATSATPMPLRRVRALTAAIRGYTEAWR